MPDTCSLTQETEGNWVIGARIGLGVYIGLTLLGVVIRFTRSQLYRQVTMSSSRALHDQMYTAVIRSPVLFYDSNPKGRILNRFSGDIGATDGKVPNLILEMAEV